MFYPPLYPAEVVFEGTDLTRTVKCTCGKQKAPKGRLVVYSHTQGTENYGWFLVCTGNCYLRNVNFGSTC